MTFLKLDRLLFKATVVRISELSSNPIIICPNHCISPCYHAKSVIHATLLRTGPQISGVFIVCRDWDL